MKQKIKLPDLPKNPMREIFNGAGITNHLLGLYAGVSQSSISLYMLDRLSPPEQVEQKLKVLADAVKNNPAKAEALLSAAINNKN